MDETVTTTKSALWAGRIQNFYSSGLSRKAWCQTNKVPLLTLSYWIRKLAKGSGEQQQDHEPVFARMPSEHEIRSITASVWFESSGQEIPFSPAAFKTLLTVFLDTPQLRAMFV